MGDRTPERERAEETWAAMVASGEAAQWIPKTWFPGRDPELERQEAATLGAMRVEALQAALAIGAGKRKPEWVLRDADQFLAWLTGETDGT